MKKIIWILILGMILYVYINIPMLKNDSDYCKQVQYGVNEWFVTSQENIDKCFY